ncbi:hypothetical protein HYE68_000232 [Fusarium pseudograminearum]|nr:hypothetical protein HYE68_000232 [Fusarium pseudograminearum]
MNSSLLWVVFLGLSATQGAGISQPRHATQAGKLDHPPETTDILDLRRRETSQTATSYLLTIAPHNTCGYLSGQPGIDITCESQLTCMWVTSRAIICGEEGDANNWKRYNRCHDSSYALDPSRCANTCVKNKFNLLCTNATAPYCVTYAFPSGVSYFECSESSTELLTASFTFSGQINARLKTSTIYIGPSDSQDTASTETPTVSSTAPYSSSPTSTSSSSSPPSSSNQINLGAIIGGAVGGFVAISLVALAIFWTIRKSRNEKGRQSMQVDPLDHSGGKTEAQIDWRSSTATALSWPTSASPQTGTGQPTSPSALSETSQGIMSPMRPQMTHEMSGESVQSPPHELADSRIYELGSGSTDR